MKLRLVREAAREWAKRRDRDTMLFEDDMSYLTGLYFDALTRRRDYDRYFILAARYGPFSEKEFTLDARPGQRYLLQATEGAVKLQRLWVRFWAITKLRRYRAAKCIQKYVRRFIVYKRLHPIIRVRLKFGKRTYYAFFWQKWQEYNTICRNIRMALHYRQYEVPLKCLLAWKRFVLEEKEHRQQVLNRLAVKYGRQSAVHYTFTLWVTYRDRNRFFKRKLRRLIQNPLFETWVEFTQFSKHVKRLSRAATKLQSVARGRAVRRRYRRQRRAQRTLRDFARLIEAKKLCSDRRDRTVGELFASWGPEETATRNARLNEAERQRLLRRSVFVQQKEKAAVAELKKHFKSPDGLLQVKDRVAELLEGECRAELVSLSGDQRLQFAAQELIARCTAVTRQLNSHDYNAKNPPFILCPFPDCSCSLTTEAQYHSHVASLPLHVDLSHSFSKTHLMIRHAKGFELTRAYLLRTHGLAGPINSLDFWAALQEWRKTPTARKDFFKRALTIYEMFLADDAPRKIHLDAAMTGNISNIRSRMQLLKHRESEGYFEVAQAKRSLLRQLLGLSAQTFEKWSDMHVLNPVMFNEVEWCGFRNIFTALEKDVLFKESVEYREYQKIYEADLLQRESDLLEDCKSYRNNLIYEWVVEYQSHETAMRTKAEEIALLFLQREADKMMQAWSETEVHRRMKQVSYEEQVRYEVTNLVLDDAVAWAEEDVVEFVFDFYVRNLLERMWAIPDCQKGMLEYSGLLKSKLKKKLTAMVDMNSSKAQKASAEWFEDFMKQTVEVDQSNNKQITKSSHESKATCIQRRIRGVFGRNRVRKLFVKTYAKRLDGQSKAYYYVNLRTNSSSWTRPKITDRLFHGSKW